MAAQARRKDDPKTTPAQEKLWYFATLRQMEAQSEAVRGAYGRLAALTLEASGWNVQTVILDWLEAELRSLRQTGTEASAAGTHLMRAAVALSSALKQ